MANQLAANPLMVDVLDDEPLFTGQFYIDHINYVGWSDPSHVAYVTDSNGNEIALLSGATMSTTYHCAKWVKGITVPTLLADGITPNLASGHLLFYFK